MKDTNNQTNVKQLKNIGMEKYFILTVETKYGKRGVDNTVLETYEIPYTKEGRQLPLDKAHEVIKKYADCDYEVWAYADFYSYDEVTGRKYKKDVFALNNKGFYKNYYFEGYKIYIDDSNNLKHKDMKRINDNDSEIYVVEIYNDTEEFDITPMSLSHEYYDLDEAIDDLEREMESYNNDPNEIVGWVLAGEYETEDGDIYGETEVVYEISNKDYVSDSRRRVRDGLTRSERYNRNMERIFANAERFNQNQMKWLREQGISEDEIQNAKRNTGLHGSKLSELVIQTARANGDTRENSEILGEAMGISDSRTHKGSIGSRIADAKAKYFSKDLKNLQAYRRVTDSEGKIKEDVVFLIEDSDVLAVFPNTYGTANRDQDTMVCYSHNGQHGVCTYDYANTLKTADSKQYNELKDELANYVGYNLTIVDSLPSEAELKQNGKEIRDSYIRFRRGLQAIDDARMLARGEEIEYKGKRGTVQYALFHGQQPVIIRWQNEDGSEEFEVPYNQVASLKVSDSEDDVNIEQADSDLDDAEVTDGCGKKGKKKAKKTADAVKKVKITKRQTKKAE